MLFFAFVDPAPFAGAVSRTADAYSLGFFFFWAICALLPQSPHGC
jgi:hypothetical protein